MNQQAIECGFEGIGGGGGLFLTASIRSMEMEQNICGVVFFILWYKIRFVADEQITQCLARGKYTQLLGWVKVGKDSKCQSLLSGLGWRGARAIFRCFFLSSSSVFLFVGVCVASCYLLFGVFMVKVAQGRGCG